MEGFLGFLLLPASWVLCAMPVCGTQVVDVGGGSCGGMVGPGAPVWRADLLLSLPLCGPCWDSRVVYWRGEGVREERVCPGSGLLLALG